MPRGSHNQKLSDDARAEVVRRYTTPLPDGTWEGSNIIADDLGVSPITITYHLKKAGVVIRTSKEAHAHGKRCGPIKHTEQLETPPLCACGCGKSVPWIRSAYVWGKYARGHYRKDAPYKSREWLIEQYVNKRRNLTDIARECGVVHSAIAKFMRKFGIPRRDAREAHIGTQMGKNNPAWKGGVTPERQRLYKSQEWKALVSSVYARDNYICRRCQKQVSGVGKRRAHAHHIKSWADYPELRKDPSNLVTLCRTCHEWVHSLENTSRDFL